MQDKLEDVISAALTRATVESLPGRPTIDLISFARLTQADIPAIRKLQERLEHRFGVRLAVVGGGHGCTRIKFSIVTDSEDKAGKILQQIFTADLFREAALEAEFHVAILPHPYTRLNLRTGDAEGLLADTGLLLFYSYSHADEAYRIELNKHLAGLRREGLIKEWHDRKITAGRTWDSEISNHLDLADIVLLLVSADFMDSDYCFNVEMNRALERHQAGECRVIPVIVRPTDWENLPFAKLQIQAVPKDGHAVTLWPNRDEAWKDVSRKIRETVEEIRKNRPRFPSF